MKATALHTTALWCHQFANYLTIGEENKMDESELKDLLIKLQAQAEEQEPYIDDRILNKILQIESLLAENNL